jgi:uncharacterized membrane protein
LSYYEILLFLHIGAAAIWFGGAFLFFVLFQRAKSARDPQLAQRLGAHTEWMAQRVFIPTSLTVLVLGILLTIEGPWGFDELWILLGLGGMAVTFVLGIGLIEPTAKKMHGAIEAHGPAHPEVARYNRRLDAFGVLDLTLLIAIIWDMVLKPTSDDLGTLLIPALALAAAGLYVFRAYRIADSEVATTTA